MKSGPATLVLAALVLARSTDVPVVLAESRAAGPTFAYEDRLLGHGDPLPQGGARFGSSVSLSGDTLVVGAGSEDTPVGGLQGGSAYVFVRSGTTWSQQQRLNAADGGPFEHFGAAVSVDGDTVIVGAPGHDAAGADSGAAYVFVRSGTTWTQQQKLLPSDPSTGDSFGASVAISGDTAVIGATGGDTPGGGDAGSAYVFVRTGTTWGQQQKLIAPDGAPLDYFGFCASLEADTAIIGAPTNLFAFKTGSAYVFVRSGTAWALQQKLLASDGALQDQFGLSVSLSGDTAVVGAPFEDNAGGTDAGSMYAFVRAGATWSQQQKLQASDGAAEDRFGHSVSVSGDTAVAGALYDDTTVGNTGSAYVFARSGGVWAEQQKLTSPAPDTGDEFGYSIAVAGDTVAVGAHQDETAGGWGAGSVDVFVRNGTSWTEEQRIVPTDGDQGDGDQFGNAVSVSGDTLVVGSRTDVTPAGLFAGSAYVFVRSGAGWTLQQKLTASDGSPRDFFGTRVSVSGDTVVVGAYQDDTPAGADAGSAYVFVRSGNTWTEQQKLVAPDGAAGDQFGNSVSVFGDTIVVGAWWDDTATGTDAGSAYVFVRSGTTWSLQQKLLAPDAQNWFGFSASIFGDTALVGAPLSGPPPLGGAAYVFVRSGAVWTQQQRLDGVSFFGLSLSLFGDTAVVGAPGIDFLGYQDVGAAYVFERSGTTWTQQQELMAPDFDENDQFGFSLSVSGETLAVMAPYHEHAGSTRGAVYVFTRSGTAWTEQQELLPPGGVPFATFDTGTVSLSGAELVIGSPFDMTPFGSFAGAVYAFHGVFTGPHADLIATKTDGQATAVPGEPLTYTIAVANAGPDPVTGASVTDVLPPSLLAPTWTCTATTGSSCTPSGSGNINDNVDVTAGGSATYEVTGTVASGSTGTISNIVTVTPPPAVPDPDPANNSAVDTDSLAPATDLSVTKTDSADPVSVNDPLTYDLIITNNGPSDATGVTVTDTLPAGVTFVSSTPGPPVCTFAGGTVSCSLGTLSAGATSSVSILTTVNGSASGILVNTASVAGNEPDPDPKNNTGSAATAIGSRAGELAHGTDAYYDLAAQGGVADEDTFRISQKPYSSYEVVVDATSGDIGAAAGPSLQRMAADGATVLQDSTAIGAGPSRSLRWRNSTAAEVEGETIRVRSAECGTDCGPDDVYRIRTYETTYSIPRFNNAGTQVTVLILQNPTSYPLAGEAHFRVSSGGLVATQPFTLGPKATLVLNTATIPGAGGVSGGIIVAHDGRYGDLSGKTVALEPSTGFSFDSPLVPRIR